MEPEIYEISEHHATDRMPQLSVHNGRYNLAMGDRAIILFDGVCNLCNGWVNFVIDRDPDARFAFAPLQSEEAESILDDAGMSGRFDSIVLVDDGKLYEKSDAVLAIAKQLESGWRYLHLFKAVPRSIRDAVYDFIANRRYSWFGQRDTCRVPGPDTRSRFL